MKTITSSSARLFSSISALRKIGGMLMLAILILSGSHALAQEKKHPTDPLPPAACLTADAKVTCGQKPGTYVITLSTTGAGGLAPDQVSITPTTPGVTIVGPQSNYAVTGGVVKITVVGATPGDVLTFDVEGTKTGAGAVEGSDLCCNGTIKVVIPKDLPCEKSTVDIAKICEPAVYRKYALGPAIDALGWVSMCHIKVTTTGAQNGTLTVNDSLTGGGTVVSAYSTTLPSWTCAGASCSVNGANLNQTSSVSNIDMLVAFPSMGHVSESANCAAVVVNGKEADKDCVKFIVEETKVSVTKVCDPAKHVWIGDLPPKKNMPPNGYVAMCHIKVSTTGPVINPISISEVLSGAGTVTYAGATDPWTCAPPMVPGNAPMNCTLPGNVMTGPSDTSVIDVKVTFTSAGAVKDARNCAVATYAGKELEKSCEDFVIDEGTVSVDKKCEPAVYGKYPVSQVATGLGLHANCAIKVTTTGPQTGTISVGDTLVGTGTVVNMTAPAPWTCATPNCSVNGAALNQTTSTTVISAIAVFANTGDAMEAKNCAIVGIAGKPADESCTPIIIDKAGTLTVTKEAAYNGSHITNVSFPIAVTCGGTVTNASFADGAPYVQTNIPLSSACSVVEGAAPATGLCGKGQIEVWTTTYTPPAPVMVTSGGAAIHVKNVLSCEPIINPTPSTQTITKVCEPATEVIGAINSWQSICHITVSTTGPQSGNMTVSDSLAGGGTITSITGPAPWTCSATGCTADGSLLDQTTSNSVIDAVVSFPSKGHVVEGNNCATLATNGTPVEACTGFTVGEGNFDLDVKKDCSAVIALTANGPWAGACTITVTATGGPRPPVIAISDVISDVNPTRTPPIAMTSMSSADPWVCTATSVSGPANCTIAGNAFPTSGTSTLNIDVQVPLGVNSGEAKNCVKAFGAADAQSLSPSSPPVETGEVCVPLPGGTSTPPSGTGTISVTKECDPAVPTGATNNWGAGQDQGGGGPQPTHQAICRVTVIGSGSLPPTIELTESMMSWAPAAGSPMQINLSNMTSPQNWQFPQFPAGQGSSTSMPGSPYAGPPVIATLSSAELLAAGGQSTITVTAQFMNAGWVSEAQNCVQASGVSTPGAAPGVQSQQVCVPFTVATVTPPAKPVVTVEKTCTGDPQAHDADQDDIHDTFTCQIKVTVTGGSGSGNLFIEDMVADATGNLAGVATIQSISSSDPWDCNWNGPITGTASADYCTIPVSAISNGTSIINVVMADGPEPGPGPYQNCARHGNFPGHVDNPDNSNTSCARIDGLSSNVKVVTPACDPTTATNAGDLCRCRFDNMQKVSKTACECGPGFTLKAGQGCVRKVVEPRCDPATTVTKGGKCVCEYKNMVQTSASACACTKGFRFAQGKGCFRPEPVCGKNQVLVKGVCTNKPPVCGRNQVLVKGVCTNKQPVCGKNQVLVKGRCTNKEPFCRPPFKYDAKRRACIEQVQRCGPGQIRIGGKCARVPKCGFGQIPVPGTGICVSIGGGGRPKDTPRDTCVPTATRACD